MTSKLKRVIKASIKDDRSTVDRINDYVYSLYNKPSGYKAKPGFAPSALGAKCLRKIYYGYWRVEKDFGINDAAAKIFRTGDLYEDMVMEWLKGIGEHIPFKDLDGNIPERFGKIDPQFEISSEEWSIRRGYIDNVAIVDGKLWIYEIKSSNEKKFKEQVGPQEPHKYQAGIYYHAFNQMLSQGKFSHIKELDGYTKAYGVKYLYINKNNSQIKEYIVKGVDLTNHIKAISDRVVVMNEYIDAKKLPEMTKDYCFFCPYGLKCKKSWNLDEVL